MILKLKAQDGSFKQFKTITLDKFLENPPSMEKVRSADMASPSFLGFSPINWNHKKLKEQKNPQKSKEVKKWTKEEEKLFLEGIKLLVRNEQKYNDPTQYLSQ